MHAGRAGKFLWRVILSEGMYTRSAHNYRIQILQSRAAGRDGQSHVAAVSIIALVLNVIAKQVAFVLHSAVIVLTLARRCVLCGSFYLVLCGHANSLE
jgi:hypothetical protein